MDQSKKIIKVAILADELLGWGSGKHYFQAILENYTWEKNNTIYQFSTQYVTDKEILNGVLQISKYDVLVVPGGGVGDGHAVIKGLTFLKKVKRWKENIVRFIKQGGGYVGICGGAALLTNLVYDSDRYPPTLLERLYNKSSLEVSSITSYYKHLAAPLFYLFQYNHPEKIGAASYVFSFSPGKTTNGKNIFSAGVPVDCVLEKDNPIFSDCQEETQKMRWWGGPALLVSNQDKREIHIIARYPPNDFSKQQGTMIYAWRYTGGLTGIIKGFVQACCYIKKRNLKLKKLFVLCYYFSGDWEKTDKLIDLNFSDKACMTAEIYPNENKGRIFLCSTHPEYLIWWDGYIKEVNRNDFHCIAKGFHQWNDISMKTSSAEHELTYTWWIVRRMVAWAAKIQDDHLPPKENISLNKDAKKILSEEIFWDGTMLSQIKNI